eukprot:GHVQ01040837.1.p2 GENE.GHVQ01040837.1~~GHVQ01040837.1.p2  ORF type:complete len:110 (+),score=15.02 GHVQ01040837.1:264-593(+)
MLRLHSLLTDVFKGMEKYLPVGHVTYTIAYSPYPSFPDSLKNFPVPSIRTHTHKQHTQLIRTDTHTSTDRHTDGYHNQEHTYGHRQKHTQHTTRRFTYTQIHRNIPRHM